LLKIFKLGHHARKKLHDYNVISVFDNDHAMALITFLYEYLLPNPEDRLQVSYGVIFSPLFIMMDGFGMEHTG